MWVGEIVTLLPITEILVNDSNGLVGVEVAGETDGYIVRNIIMVEIVLDICDGRILQMLLGTNSRLSAVRVMRKEFLAQRYPLFSPSLARPMLYSS